MARAAAPMLRGLLAPTSTTRRRSLPSSMGRSVARGGRGQAAPFDCARAFNATYLNESRLWSDILSSAEADFVPREGGPDAGLKARSIPRAGERRPGDPMVA